MVLRRSLRGGGPPEAAPAVLPRCPLCGRLIEPGPSADEHHLLPRSQGGRDKTLVHRICHRKIHSVLGPKELARGYASWEALRAHPEIAGFVAWLAGKPPSFDDRSRPPGRRR